MFAKSNSEHFNEFLQQTKAARMERIRDRKWNLAAVKIQACVRAFITRRRIRREILQEFASVLKEENDGNPCFVDAIEVFKVTNKFLFIFNAERDKHLFERLCRYLIASMLLSSNDPLLKEDKISYVSVGFDQRYTVAWFAQLNKILWQSCVYIKHLKPELSQDLKLLMLYLNVLITFTSTNLWNIFRCNPDAYEPQRAFMNQYCQNAVNSLVSRGFYVNLQLVLIKNLCRTKPTLTKAALTAIITLSLRAVINSQFSHSSLNLLLLHIFSVPGLTYHLSNIAPDMLTVFSHHSILAKSCTLLANEQNTRILFNALEGNYGLCLLANLVHLASFDIPSLQEIIMDFVISVRCLLENCQKYVVNKQSSLTHWHPILGWFAQKVDQGLHESLSHVKEQLQCLWSSQLIQVLFSQLFELNEKVKSQPPSRRGSVINTVSREGYNPAIMAITAKESIEMSSGFLKRALEKAASVVNKNGNSSVSGCHTCSGPVRKMGTSEVTTISLICSMYVAALSTLTQVKLDILTGLCYQDLVLPNLWKFISSFGPRSSLQAFLDHLAVNTKICAPEFQLLILFCDCATHLITILDDMELYEQQRPFTIEELITISSFLNNFVFKIIWNNLIDLKNVSQNQLLHSTHTLLMVLYKRDCRRNYAPSDHWLIKDLKIAGFMKDLENGKKSAQILMQKVPHIIPHKERVVLFRKHVNNEKSVLGLTESACASPQSTLITVHRSRIVEDGYQQLAMLPAQSLKGVIRVKFINEQGLDEAGIDQDGVFKEFLEETIKKVFDPSLNLFRVTSEQRLYPSPTSYIHENHLSLFEFVGKMLGKAVYEGIVVDVPFASFFLSQVLGHQQSALYSSIDELPSLDPELYKSLTYIKHYEGDVADLDLTFSVDEDCMGQLVTHELIPGGKVVPVTKETRISYIHLMAHFRMHTQIHEQTAAFIRGFRCIVNPDWLIMFSTPEFQRLISGDNTPIDLADLRRNTKYYGGFHNNHRVINWFWDILEKDFKPHEHRLLLKFVTSCSKPPLLGFAHLEPPFSIRCVEVSDDQDVGDTVGSVLRGFFTIRRKDPVNRLPTSSTCFNLLKLPNYQKKSTLREKLRYAISSNTGFELS
ncbi:ubiquitin-protein ligase E3B-like protein [Dinothrombium tinctorium]|uniref:Ubiquitin-protein ligase E3B n=1 Tax=Dinothrombium tinctorium TaxID=1965070 RepID=A0A443RA78_9ACAR|nr:ubiquitin-protein ligase E3B-like protein [Dinothrombium tinctorium]RWS12177.1 ubiquitin-protein ligase E3B-like protein [Dinothrombium tinctorium]